MHEPLLEFVPRGAGLLALDIGAGAGRDAAWLQEPQPHLRLEQARASGATDPPHAEWPPATFRAPCRGKPQATGAPQQNRIAWGTPFPSARASSCKRRPRLGANLSIKAIPDNAKAVSVPLAERAGGVHRRSRSAGARAGRLGAGLEANGELLFPEERAPSAVRRPKDDRPGLLRATVDRSDSDELNRLAASAAKYARRPEPPGKILGSPLELSSAEDASLGPVETLTGIRR